MASFIEHYSETVIAMELFMDHTCPSCQETDALMNFYEISYKRN